MTLSKPYCFYAVFVNGVRLAGEIKVFCHEKESFEKENECELKELFYEGTFRTNGKIRDLK